MDVGHRVQRAVNDLQQSGRDEAPLSPKPRSVDAEKMLADARRTQIFRDRPRPALRRLAPHLSAGGAERGFTFFCAGQEVIAAVAMLTVIAET